MEHVSYRRRYALSSSCGSSTGLTATTPDPVVNLNGSVLAYNGDIVHIDIVPDGTTNPSRIFIFTDSGAALADFTRILTIDLLRATASDFTGESNIARVSCKTQTNLNNAGDFYIVFQFPHFIDTPGSDATYYYRIKASIDSAGGFTYGFEYLKLFIHKLKG